MDGFEISNVAAITVICMLVAQGVKATALDNKWLPVVCGTCGAVLGLVGFHVVPNYPAGDVLTAVAGGILSGLAGTGAHQVYKQLLCRQKKAGDKTEETTEEP